MTAIIDNINKLLGDDLKSSLKASSKLKIAASCFSIYAYEALKKELSKIDSLEFIFTAPTFVPNEVTDKVRKERREFFIPKADRESVLYGSEFEIRLRNQLTQRAIARECARWIKKKARFKSNTSSSPMQQFACIEGKSNIAYAPISGFTAVDLGYERGDAVSNLTNRLEDMPNTEQYIKTFKEIWRDPEKLQDVTDAICEHIETVYTENSPERVYFFILYNIFHEFLEESNEDFLPKELTGYKDTAIWQKLYNFQQDAAVGIINKLENYNGCILADSVGLGKTFTALGVIKYYELRNNRVLVLCPKRLSDNWLNYNSNIRTNIFLGDNFRYDVLCHTDLSRTSGSSNGNRLDLINWGNYDLVVIDESHNFRNDIAFKERETRYQKLMNKVIRDGLQTKVLMLSATPVNNQFNDLKNQLALAYEGDSDRLKDRLRTDQRIEQIFRQAQQVFNEWSRLPKEERTAEAILSKLDFDFFELLDSVTIARSRKHIETFYNTEDIGKFPVRKKPLSFHPPLTYREDVMTLNEIFEQLRNIKMVVYAPISYVYASRLGKYEDIYDTKTDIGTTLKQSHREQNLQALMTTNLLKRLESSVEAFRLTLKSLKQNIDNTLAVIDDYKTGKKDLDISDEPTGFEDVDSEEQDLSDDNDSTIGNKVKIKLNDMDIDRWHGDLTLDLYYINELIESMEKVTPEDDAKLQHIKQHIFEKIANPINANNKKILIFTAFADTAHYLYKNLADDILQNSQLHSGVVTGSRPPKTTLESSSGRNHDYQSILTLFSPLAKEKQLVMPDEEGEIDILIGTDCIAEGQNLQDCDYLINYDIHWNPVRIIQRFGRIDRIGSPNAEIQLVNYWPDIDLDDYINLKERVENRMVIVDVTAAADGTPLNSNTVDSSYRDTQLRRLQNEVIELEDVRAGISITDLGLNDFRIDLLNYMRDNDDLGSMPKGIHAVVPANEELGLHAGVLYVFRNHNSIVNTNDQNRLHPYYLIYTNEKEHILANHTEVKLSLDLLRTSCKGQSEPIKKLCKDFNKFTEDGRDMSYYSALLTGCIQEIMHLRDEKDIDSLFTTGSTSALVDSIAGLDDFELIAFIVIRDESLIDD